MQQPHPCPVLARQGTYLSFWPPALALQHSTAPPPSLGRGEGKPGQQAEFGSLPCRKPIRVLHVTCPDGAAQRNIALKTHSRNSPPCRLHTVCQSAPITAIDVSPRSNFKAPKTPTTGLRDPVPWPSIHTTPCCRVHGIWCACSTVSISEQIKARDKLECKANQSAQPEAATMQRRPKMDFFKL